MTPIYQNQNCDLRSSAKKSSRRACSRRGVLAGRAGRGRVGFTLVELLLAIGIIAILASLAVALVRSAEGDARASRTTTVIGNITQVIQRRVEAYETRTLPFRLNPATSLEDRRQLRNQVIVEWLRGELPTVQGNLSQFPSEASLSRFPNLETDLRASAMVKRLRSHFDLPGDAWTAENEGAECLYAILKNSWDGDNRGTHFLTPSEVGDTDGDGFLEVLDGWGDPMEFSIFARVNPFAPNDPPTLNDFVFNIDSSRDF